jgi:hypothetical protein
MVAETLVTIANAAQILSIGLDIAMKANTVLNTEAPASIDEELQRLDAARLRPSAEIIAEADKAGAA